MAGAVLETIPRAAYDSGMSILDPELVHRPYLGASGLLSRHEEVG